MEPPSLSKPRIDWLDAAKGYGIFLVFYGHFVESVYNIGDHPAALLQPHLLFWCTLVTIGTMLSLAPLVWLLNRYLPQLVGRPRSRGPLLPNLVE